MSLNVIVIGTVFMDCKGWAKEEYNPLGRNLGNIKFVHGGVGRNVAENLSRLAIPTTFVSSVDKTPIGQDVLNRLHKAGVDVRYIDNSSSRGMGMWLVILDEKGELTGSISQMPRLDILDKIINSEGEAFVNSASHIALELDLNDAITKSVLALAKTYKKPVYGIPGNLDVIRRNMNILSGLECFICNDIEAGRLLGISLSALNIDDMQAELIKFVKNHGLISMVITLGSKGSIYYDSRIEKVGYQPVFPVKVVDSSGAGDAFFSGTVMGLVHKMPLEQSVVIGTKVASWTIESQENNCTDLQLRTAEDDLFKNLIVNGLRMA